MEPKNNPFPFLAGILFALMALLQLFTLMGYFTFWNVVYLAAYCCLTAVVLLQRRDMFTVGAFGLAALAPLMALFLGPLPLLDLLAYLAMFLMALSCLLGYLPAIEELAQKLWFLPAALGTLSFVVRGIYSITLWAITGHGMGTSVLMRLLAAAGLFFAGAWVVYPEGLPPRQSAARSEPVWEDGDLPTGAYCDLFRHTLLLVFTFGIWHLIWIYRTTRYLNQQGEAPFRNPTTKLLLCLFVPFYYVYWTYRSAQQIDRLAREIGYPADLTLPCLILSLFVPILSAVLLQDKLNELADSALLEDQDLEPPSPILQIQDYQDAAEALRTFKALLDEGILTQEEFAAKKKQILGL